MVLSNSKLKKFCGTGFLGQPSTIYAFKVSRFDNSPYYLMKLKGHGHHSAQNGQVYSDMSSITSDMSSITTAKNILERIPVKVTFQ